MGLGAMSIDECVRALSRENADAVAAVERAGPEIAAFVRAVEPGFARGGRLVYVGAGTSGRLGVLDASEAPPTFCVEHGRIVGIIAGGSPALVRSSEGLEDEPEGARADLEGLHLTADDSVLGITAGGTTPYVIGALTLARELSPGSVTGLLSCAEVPRPPAADHLIVLACGPEPLTGSTRMKAGSATKMALNAISTTLMVRTGRVYENLMVDVRATNAKLRDRAARIVAEVTGLGREECFSLLDRAGGSAKAAIVMHARGVDADGAKSLLDAAGGLLSRVLAP
jgi:N-acetylmuramic acid 6-phosphate etherase